MAADNNDKTGGSSGNTLPVVVMVALLAAGVVVKTVPLESSRPPDVERAKFTPSGQQEVEARLWQDPLAAVDKYMEKLAPAESGRSISSAAGPEDKFFLDKPSGKPSDQEKSGHLTVLAVSVPGGSFNEGAEWRRRSRFAVISALSFHGYNPKNPNALGYFCMDLRKQEPLIVPYERFERQGRQSRVLVLWLNENRFFATDKPLDSLRELFKSLFRNLKGPSVKLIGPVSSGMLEKLVRDIRASPREESNGFEVFVPTATISNGDLALLAKDGEQGEWLELKGFPIVRTIGSDDVLAAALLWELWQRGVNRDGGFQQKCEDGLVLLSELDTPYGRALSKDLKEGFTKRCGLNPPVHVFTYLRGLDGVLPNIEKSDSSKSSKNDQDESEKTGNLRAQLDDALKEHAEGRNQYDYLRRITKEIKRLDSNRFAKNGIRAIGVVGTDVYDKLLILQALRTQFKDKIFFTTDLDARYLHADQKAWTRNLVVASNFDLSLHPALQATTPPFRDSYQTSTYLATLMALDSPPPDGWNAKMQKWLRPQIFEIGRTEAVHLASPSKEYLASWLVNSESEKAYDPVKFSECDIHSWEKCSSLEPERPYRGLQLPSRENLLKIIITILLGIFLIALTNRGAGEFSRKLFSSVHTVAWNTALAAIFGVVLVGLVFLILYIVRSQVEISLAHGNGEPFVWLEGVSVWPSLVVRFTGLVLLLMLITVFVARMRHKALSIAGRFGLKIVRPKPWKPRFWGLDRKWHSAICRGPNIDFTSFDMNGKIRASGQQAKSNGFAVVALWRNYLCVTRWRHMWPWVAICTVLAFSFVYFIFQLLNDPPFFPHRGMLVKELHVPLLYFSVLALWITIFWVGYETRACASFVHVLSNTRPEWPIRLLDQQEVRTGISRKYLGDYLAFKLIVRVTGRIHGLIYLPFVLILFMVLARTDLFDAMDFPLPLLLGIGLALAYTLYTVRLLYKSGKDARAKVLVYYKNLRLCLLCPPPKFRRKINQGKIKQEELAGTSKPKFRRKIAEEELAGIGSRPRFRYSVEGISRDQVEWLINDVANTRKGVFAPPTQQPWLQALLLPFGGYGGVQLVEYLLNFFAFG